jgi:hypothetical protein
VHGAVVVAAAGVEEEEDHPDTQSKRETVVAVGTVAVVVGTVAAVVAAVAAVVAAAAGEMERIPCPCRRLPWDWPDTGVARAWSYHHPHHQSQSQY